VDRGQRQAFDRGVVEGVIERIGILGGTFDPIHCGHLDAARAARTALGLDTVLMVPSHIPPHRPLQPVASPFHRFAMTALAVNGVEGLVASEEELCAAGPSYTAETLERYHRRGLEPRQIFFITGVDAFAEIETWRQYPAVLEMAHFVVVSRPGYDARDVTARLPLLTPRMREAARFDGATRQTSILLLDAVTGDVSSSDVRTRLASGAPITGLVPLAVETHIRQHHLYTSHARADARVAQADELHGQS
jgi:nicotinate-nucleotide adenylyltransferase